MSSFGTAARSANRARSARGDFAMQSVAPMEQWREALTEREALEVILGGIYVQCNKRSPLVFIKNKEIVKKIDK